MMQRKVEQQAAAGGPYILANMIRLALSKYAASRSSQDVSETVRTQADPSDWLEGRLEAEFQAGSELMRLSLSGEKPGDTGNGIAVYSFRNGTVVHGEEIIGSRVGREIG